MPKISTKNQITIPIESLRRAGIGPGDEVAIESAGEDRIVIRKVKITPADALGVFDGLYEPGYLERLRAEERA